MVPSAIADIPLISTGRLQFEMEESVKNLMHFGSSRKAFQGSPGCNNIALGLLYAFDRLDQRLPRGHDQIQW